MRAGTANLTGGFATTNNRTTFGYKSHFIFHRDFELL
jgi:hypothetical protein